MVAETAEVSPENGGSENDAAEGDDVDDAVHVDAAVAVAYVSLLLLHCWCCCCRAREETKSLYLKPEEEKTNIR